MSCRKTVSRKPDTRAMLLAMYAKLVASGREEYAKDSLERQRLAKCASASECRRFCPRLAKEPGKSGVFCVDIETSEKIRLYDVLDKPEFTCPEGLF